MSSPIISVENLGKKYRIKHEGRQRYTALRDVISQKAKGVFKKLKPENLKSRNISASQPLSISESSSEDFWALKNVSFEVQQGEVLGIIGRNGAGKSTLLKILSRITEPTEGRVTLRGRVASLLEVGTGFHPELTGRENIYLNGTILGMTRAEIRKRFEEIVSFAEVEKFLDTPVKHYSSGMYVRLAFAVAAHMEPEILIVDEVLAVGDAEFQNKCLGKMQDVTNNHGRTVIFVSHQMAAIRSFCKKCILLDHGGLLKYDLTSDVIRHYVLPTKNISSAIKRNIIPGQQLVITSLRLVDIFNRNISSINRGSEAFVHVEFTVLVEGASYSVSFELISDRHATVFTSCSFDSDPRQLNNKKWAKGYYVASIMLPTENLRNDSYCIKAMSAIPGKCVLDRYPIEVHFHYHNAECPTAVSGEERQGAILPVIKWNIGYSGKCYEA